MVLERHEVCPVDILDGARSLSVRHFSSCILNAEWLNCETYLEWAKRGLRGQDDYGLSNAVSYSKLAVCRRIDGLLQANHLSRFDRRSCPEKIEWCSRLDIHIPDIVNQLVIEPRNLLEHRYQRPTLVEAQRAVELAELFVRATDEEGRRHPIVSMGWGVLYSHTIGYKREEEVVHFSGFLTDPMLFLDIFEAEPEIKIVFPEENGVHYARLSAFTNDDLIDLVRILRSGYSGSGSFSGAREYFYREIKRQSGL